MKYKYIAIDFDGTIVEDRFPDIGPLLPAAKETMQRIKKEGGEITIWTCREGESLQAARSFLIKEQIPFDYLNRNHPALIQRFNNDCRKIGADLYIDDKAMFQAIDWNDIAEHLFA